MALIPNGDDVTVVVVYLDSDGRLTLATRKPFSDWVTEPVTSPGHPSLTAGSSPVAPALAVDALGRPHVVWMGWSGNALLLRYFTQTTGSWSAMDLRSEVVTPGSFQQRLCDIAIRAGIEPAILVQMPIQTGEVGERRLFSSSGLQLQTPLGSPAPLGPVALATREDQSFAMAFQDGNLVSVVAHPSGPANHNTSLIAGSKLSSISLQSARGGSALAFTLQNTPIPPSRSLRISLSLPQEAGPFAGMGISLHSLIRSVIGGDRSAALSPSELLELTTLNISSSRISDLKPLAGAKNLGSLHAFGSRVTDLTPLLHLPLKTLDVSSCGLDPRSGSVSSRQIEKLQRGGTSVFWSNQRVPWNWLTQPALEDRLRSAFFGSGTGKWASAWTWSGVEDPSATFLDLSNLGLTDLEPLRAFRQLETLSATGNFFGSIESLAGLSKLRWIDLSAALNDSLSTSPRIRDLSPFRGLRLVHHLNLRGNEVTDLGAILNSFAPGAYLNVSENGLAISVGLPNPSTTADRQLEELRRKMVFIDSFSQKSPWNWILDPGIAASIRTRLGIPTTTVFSPAHHEALTSLVAENTGVESLTGLDLAVNLQSLSVANNQIRDVSPLARLSGVGSLDLRNNQITDLSPLESWNRDDAEILLSGNGLDLREGSPTWGTVGRLRRNGLNIVADLSNQRNPWNWMLDPALETAIRSTIGSSGEFTWAHATQLSSLRASGVADLSGLELAFSLRELRLPNNTITDLAPLAGLTKLTLLDIGRNPLFSGYAPPSLPGVRSIEPLRALRRLVELDISGHQISDLAPIRESIVAGGYLDIADNGIERQGLQGRIIADLEYKGVLINIGQQASPWNWQLDATTAAAVAASLGLPSGRPFTPTDHGTLRSLDLSNTTVEDLSWLSTARSLERLVLPEGFSGIVPPLASLSGPVLIETASARTQSLQSEREAGRNTGRQEILSNPVAAGLYREDHIMEARFGAKTIRLENGRFNVRWSIESSNNLGQWNEVETIDSEFVIPEKYFLRLRAKDAPAGSTP